MERSGLAVTSWGHDPRHNGRYYSYYCLYPLGKVSRSVLYRYYSVKWYICFCFVMLLVSGNIEAKVLVEMALTATPSRDTNWADVRALIVLFRCSMFSS